ncbi:U3 small nucleolar RNA-associated 14 B isoform 1 [Olea europaea subsp. europaea]|uniref:U3 small nucleolar RNA-associated 14 B isoform 1 n=1 Tax=Olea europaea subsp. europaea TaxID=158383 RepID=A0A8S0PBA7_OLEEU|nr:U3 small nucleolar RNA-associated 14 B isoform 1 [Olea europaea subsp. europaea]
MQSFVQFSINFSALNPLYKDLSTKHRIFKLKFSQPTNYYSLSRTKVESLPKDRLKIGVSSFGVSRGKNGILSRTGRAVVVRFNKGFNGIGRGGGGGAGGGGKVNSETARILGNLALAILLTYLSMTGQLGWLLDAIVSIWILAVLIPIVGLGAFLWWAGRDIVQGSCPNCGNEFQIFKSTLNDELQLCPFCSQPFSVVGDEFVADPVKFSNESSIFDQTFSDFSPRTKKGLLLYLRISD